MRGCQGGISSDALPFRKGGMSRTLLEQAMPFVRVGILRALMGTTALLLTTGQSAIAQLAITAQFDPSGSSSNCGLAVDSSTHEVWVHGCSSADIQRYSTAGALLSSVPRGGESANDVDVEITTKPISLASTTLPSNALLFINGETGPAEIYALDKGTGAVISTLNTAFGVSHVVGGAYHRIRQSLFLIQDLVPAAADENRVAEIDLATGSILNTFQITSTFSVNFGDLEVCNSTGNLIVVSSDENRIAEYTPAGALVQYHPLPVGVSSLSGIGVDESTGELWVASSAGGGDVWRLSGGPCAPTPVPALSGSARSLLALLLVVGGAWPIWRHRRVREGRTSS